MSEMKTLLLELHCEEIPARFLKPLTDGENGLKALLKRELEISWLFPGAQVTKKGAVESSIRDLIRPDAPTFESFYSPRKLAIRISNILEIQADVMEEQVGPPQRMCVDEAGNSTVQGQKFAEKWGVAFSELRFEQPAGKKEPCAVVRLNRPGRPAIEILSELIPAVIKGLQVPKAMRWGSSEFEFVRPIRNILCLLGSEIVPFTVDGVSTCNHTWGHRIYHMDHAEPVVVATPDAYEDALNAADVVVSFAARRTAMASQIEKLSSEVGGRAVSDEELLSTLAEIVECPTILRGEFPASFLDLPKEVLVTSLKEHQKAFCVEDAQGKLLPYFLTAANRKDDPSGFVKGGNEWVLKARLYDARFFLAEDRKHPLQDRLEKLKSLTFHRELGSYLQKTERVEALCAAMAHALGLDVVKAARAAKLSKCDLVTLMVGEFPELQGAMGGWYLEKEGADADVALAVREHYQPVSAEGPIPSTPLARLLSVADKLDTLAGCFAIGQIPSGSKDPLALRRAGQGIVRILWEQGWNLPVDAFLDLALGVMTQSASVKAVKEKAEIREALLAFFKDRVAHQLEMAGYAGPVRRSALAIAWLDLADLKARCEALSAFAEDARFASLAQSAKRIGNILKDEAPSDALDVAVLQQAEEKALAEHLIKMEKISERAALLENLAELAGPLEAFFNGVMVKCEDPALRQARLSLLHRLRKVFCSVADFSLWQ